MESPLKRAFMIISQANLIYKHFPSVTDTKMDVDFQNIIIDTLSRKPGYRAETSGPVGFLANAAPGTLLQSSTACP